MEELKYKHYTPASMEGDYAFSSSNAYTGPTSELDTRQQLSFPLWEIKKFVNDTCSTSTSSDPDDFAVKIKIGAGYLGYRTASSGTYTQVVPSHDGMVVCGNYPTMSDVIAVYGGTSWELIDKEFERKVVKDTDDGFNASNYFTPNSSAGPKASLTSFRLERSGRTIRVTMELTTTASVGSSSATKFGEFNLSGLGLNELSQTTYTICTKTTGYAPHKVKLEKKTEDNVSTYELSHVNSESNMSAGAYLFEFYPIFDMVEMLETACDKFYWRRTS